MTMKLRFIQGGYERFPHAVVVDFGAVLLERGDRALRIEGAPLIYLAPS